VKDGNFASTPTFHAPCPLSIISQALGLVLALMKPENYIILKFCNMNLHLL